MSYGASVTRRKAQEPRKRTSPVDIWPQTPGGEVHRLHAVWSQEPVLAAASPPTLGTGPQVSRPLQESLSLPVSASVPILSSLTSTDAFAHLSLAGIVGWQETEAYPGFI